MIKSRKAKGIKGFLLPSIETVEDDRLIFRVYGENHTFVDYKVNHYDLEVEIIGDDAYIYDEAIVDYPL
jgi:hypothetical protein